jgi:hypothetical protein
MRTRSDKKEYTVVSVSDCDVNGCEVNVVSDYDENSDCDEKGCKVRAGPDRDLMTEFFFSCLIRPVGFIAQYTISLATILSL